MGSHGKIFNILIRTEHAKPIKWWNYQFHSKHNISKNVNDSFLFKCRSFPQQKRQMSPHRWRIFIRLMCTSLHATRNYFRTSIWAELSWAFLSWKHQWNGNFSIIFFNCLKFMHKQIKFRRSNVEYLWLWAIKACFQLTMNTDWCIFQQAVTQKKQHRLNEKNEKKKQNTFPYIRTTHHPCINSTTKGWYAFEGSWADSKLP